MRVTASAGHPFAQPSPAHALGRRGIVENVRGYRVAEDYALPNPPERAAVLPRRLGSRIRLLMIGVLWDVKGGDIAFETLLRLLEDGFDAELTVVGCAPPAGISHSRLTVIPFLDKSVPAERERKSCCMVQCPAHSVCSFSPLGRELG